MNILPKKSWHVRTKKNIERVRRDEARAADEEKELKRRIRLAEQEARTDLLRKKAKGLSRGPIEFVTAEKEQIDGFVHVNFFKEMEDNGSLGGKNLEHEAEEKERKEKFEKDVGILTYLGQSSTEAKGEMPFYLKSSFLKEDEGEEETKSEKHKALLDPLNLMKKYVAKKGKQYMKPFEPKKARSAVQSELGTIDVSHKQEKSSEEKKPSSSDKKLSKVEELRAKRMKRELEEKKRSQKFLQELRKGPSSNQEVLADDRLRKYNSQFHPHLARNHLERQYK